MHWQQIYAEVYDLVRTRYQGMAEQRRWRYRRPFPHSPWSKTQSMQGEQKLWWRQHSPAGCSSPQAFCWRSQQECGHPPHLLLWVAPHCRPGLRLLRTIETFKFMIYLTGSPTFSTPRTHNQVFVDTLDHSLHTDAALDDGDYSLLQLVCGSLLRSSGSPA